MTLKIPALEAEAIREHGRRAFPHECCGFLLGRMESGVRHVLRVDPAFNESPLAARHHRFTITAEQAFATDREARRLGLDVIGCYHSHPDAPARPSAYDLDQATWPHYSYLILSVNAGEPAEMTSWVLAENPTRFIEETVTILADSLLLKKMQTTKNEELPSCL